jgi:hypothetical protein
VALVRVLLSLRLLSPLLLSPLLLPLPPLWLSLQKWRRL